MIKADFGRLYLIKRCISYNYLMKIELILQKKKITNNHSSFI